MKNVKTPGFQFNALTDAWLPLFQGDGTTVMASPVEVLCGEKDGVDLDYPRDDFRIYARLLLSALVQALLPAKNPRELAQRLDTPMARAEVESRIRPVLSDFELFGPKPFLQITPPSEAPTSKGAAPFVFPIDDLFPSIVPVDTVAVEIALLIIFAEQMYAGGAGRGYGAGPAGQPGALTLVDPGSVRAGAWANSLTLEVVKAKYAADSDRPWSNEKRSGKPRAATGLVEGLFFQPRGVWLVPAGTGVCSFSGAFGQLVSRSVLLGKSDLSKKPSGGEDLWQHPCAPLAVNSQGIAAIRLSAERPAWTGLAQLLRPLSKDRKAKKEHPCEGPAPVVTQWKELASRSKRPRLLVLDFVRDKANVKHRFFESFPLTEHLLDRADTVDLLRALVEDAQNVRFALVRALTRAHDDRKHGGLALADAETSFWASTEPHFFDWLSAVTAVDTWTDESDRAVDAARRTMDDALRRMALALFDAHVALSEFDPRKAAAVATARRSLTRDLYPRPAPKGPAAVFMEVKP